VPTLLADVELGKLARTFQGPDQVHNGQDFIFRANNRSLQKRFLPAIPRSIEFGPHPSHRGRIAWSYIFQLLLPSNQSQMNLEADVEQIDVDRRTTLDGFLSISMYYLRYPVSAANIISIVPR
jgi:hypothetical protein